MCQSGGSRQTPSRSLAPSAIRGASIEGSPRLFVPCEVFIPFMLPAVLRALEFDRIVEAVRSFALTPMGDDRLAGMAPAAEARRVAQLLAETSETANYV